MPKHRHGAVKRPSKKDLAGRAKHPHALAAGSFTVNRSIPLSTPDRIYYNQGWSSECVAFSSCELMTLLNGGERYHPGWLFYRAQEIDGIPGEVGTSTDACLAIMKSKGLVPWTGDLSLDDDKSLVPVLADGISGYTWFSKTPDEALDQVRECISRSQPVLIASPWYNSFGDHPRNGGVYVDPEGDWGSLGDIWHQYLIDGAYDDGEYLTTPNSWGWAASERLSYSAFRRLIAEDAGGATVIDYTGPGGKKKRRRHRRRRRHR